MHRPLMNICMQMRWKGMRVGMQHADLLAPNILPYTLQIPRSSLQICLMHALDNEKKKRGSESEPLKQMKSLECNILLQSDTLEAFLREKCHNAKWILVERVDFESNAKEFRINIPKMIPNKQMKLRISHRVFHSGRLCVVSSPQFVSS